MKPAENSVKEITMSIKKKKTLQNPKKEKIAISVKLDLQGCPLIPYIFKKDTLGRDFLRKIEQFLNLFMSKLFGGSLKMSTKNCVTK